MNKPAPIALPESGSVGWLVAVIASSGIYIAVEEALEKAAAAELLPRELWSLRFGILACANAVGDMASSLYVGFFLGQDRTGAAFGIASVVGALGVVWMLMFMSRFYSTAARASAADA